MEIPLYLAMHGAEFSACRDFPKNTAWMSCHFSLSHDALSNLPNFLPPNSMLILDDAIPFGQHDPKKILEQLQQAVRQISVEKLLLDFQRPYTPRLKDLAELLGQQLPCPVGVSHIYGQDSTLPVFVPAQGAITPLSKVCAPWKGRQIWLEIAGICWQYTLTKNGCSTNSLALQDPETFPHRDSALHCHYRMETYADRADFYLQQCSRDLSDFLVDAANHGVTAAVGFYRELKSK